MFIAQSIKTEIATITPDVAEQLLARNTKNRAVSPTNLRRVKEALLAGEWELNGEAIKIAKDGTVLDGQHRLIASVETGITFQTLVIYGLDSTAQDTMDQGKSRTIAGVLSLHGFPNATRLGAVVASIIRYERWGLRAAFSSSYVVTPKQALARLEREPEIVELPAFCRRIGALTGGVATPAVCYYALSAIDAEDAEFFYRKLETGEGLQSGSPILALRNLLINLQRDRGERNQRYLGALFIKAWNKFRDGDDDVKQLVFRVGGAKPEAFPEPR